MSNVHAGGQGDVAPNGSATRRTGSARHVVHSSAPWLAILGGGVQSSVAGCATAVRPQEAPSRCGSVAGGLGALPKRNAGMRGVRQQVRGGEGVFQEWTMFWRLPLDSGHLHIRMLRPPA